MEQIGEETKEEQQQILDEDKPTEEVEIGQENAKGKAKSRSADRHKQVECEGCFRKMRANHLKRHMRTHPEVMECKVCLRKVHADVFKRHMLKHRKLHILDENEMREEIKRRKQLQGNITEREQLIREIAEEDDNEEEKEKQDDDNDEEKEKEEEVSDTKERTDDSGNENEEAIGNTLMKHDMKVEDESPKKLNSSGFNVYSYITGHYHYQHIWTPKVGEELTSMYEVDNAYDEFAVSVLKDDKIVGHVPRELSKEFTTLLKSGGTIKVTIIANPYNTRRWGIRVPCTYTVIGKETFVQ